MLHFVEFLNKKGFFCLFRVGASICGVRSPVQLEDYQDRTNFIPDNLEKYIVIRSTHECIIVNKFWYKRVVLLQTTFSISSLILFKFLKNSAFW